MKANLLFFLALVLGHGTAFAQSTSPVPVCVGIDIARRLRRPEL